MFQTEHLQEKWQPVLEHPDLPKIEDSYRRAVTTVILENQEKALREDKAFLGEAAPTNATGSSIDNWDPILISLVRQSMPNLIAYDVCGVQPMNAPTGLIFAMKAKYKTQGGDEALFNEAPVAFSGDSSTAAQTSSSGLVGNDLDLDSTIADSINDPLTTNDPYTTAEAEALGDTTESFAEIDGSANVDALTDGLMLLRYLFGLRGDSLVDAAVANGASRSTATEIEAYIISLMP